MPLAAKLPPNAEVCPDVWEQTMQPTTEKSAIALASSCGIPCPAPPRPPTKTQGTYVKATRDFLIGKGIAKPVVKITQLAPN